MDSIAVATEIFCLAMDVLIIVGCIWAYRRFHLKSVPWILAYFVLKEIVPYFTAHFVQQAMVQHPDSGNGEIAMIFVYASNVASALANALIAWFILSELADAYSTPTPQPAIPAFISLPMRHSYAVGIVLLLCAIAIPWCGFAFSVIRS